MFKSEETEQHTNNTSVDDQATNINLNINFKNYKIIPNIISKSLILPTPESLEKLFDQNNIRNLIKYNKQKHESFINDSGEVTSLNFEKFSNHSNIKVLVSILLYLGALNKYNYFSDILGIDTTDDPRDENYIENMKSYIDYLSMNMKYLTYNLYPYDIDLLFDLLNEIGITIPKDGTNVLYNNIKDEIMSSKNKILILVAASNIFWLKSEKNYINETEYDLKLNTYNNIFYNTNFTENFLRKITNHPRCDFGIISSMDLRNVNKAIKGLNIKFYDCFPKKYFVIDKSYHITIKEYEKIDSYFRDMDKIKKYLKSNKCELFDEKNIIILESEKDKIQENTKYNSLLVNLFNEQYLEFDQETKNKIDKGGEDVINYLINLLNNCCDDVRSYIVENKRNM